MLLFLKYFVASSLLQLNFLGSQAYCLKEEFFLNCYNASDLHGFSVRPVSWGKDFRAIPGVDFVEQGLSLSVFVQVLSAQMVFNK